MQTVLILFLVLYMQTFLIILYLYAKCLHDLMLYMQSVFCIQCFICKVGGKGEARGALQREYEAELIPLRCELRPVQWLR